MCSIKELITQPAQIILDQSDPFTVCIQKAPINQMSAAEQSAQIAQPLNPEKLCRRGKASHRENEIICEMLIARLAEKSAIKAHDCGVQKTLELDIRESQRLRSKREFAQH